MLGVTTPDQSKRHNRNSSPSCQAPPETPNQPVKQAAKSPLLPVNTPPGVRAVESKYRGWRSSPSEPNEGKQLGRDPSESDEEKQRHRGWAKPYYGASFRAPNRPVNQSMGPVPLAGMLPDLLSNR